MEDISAQKAFQQFVRKPTLNQAKLNQMGQPREYFTNQLEVKFLGEKSVFQYKITTQPEVNEDSRDLLGKIVAQTRKLDSFKQFYGEKTFLSGGSMFSFKKEDEVKFLESKVGEQVYNVGYKFTNEISMQDLSSQKNQNSSPSTMQINIIIKNYLKKMGLFEMGRQKKYYDNKKMFSQEVDFQRGKDDSAIFVHSGLSMNVVQAMRGNMLQFDYSSKVINTKTLLDCMNDYKTDEEAAQNLIGKTVIANYGNKRNYRIDGFHLNKTPTSKFTTSKGEQISFQDYFFKQYQVKIKDLKQPLAFNIDKRTGKEAIFVPELMITTGISDRQRSDFKFMNQLAIFTKLTPDQRVAKFQEGSKNLIDVCNKEKLIQIIPNSNMTNGFQFFTPKIRLGKQFEQIQGGQFQLRNNILQQVNLKNWVMIYTSRGKQDDNEADKFIDDFRNVCKGFGIQMEEPGFITVKDDKASSFIAELKKDIQKNGNPDFVLSMSFQKSNIYGELKNFLISEIGVPHQHFTIKSWQKSKLSGVSKIAAQINAKMGKAVWEVESALDTPKGLMLVGIDSCSFTQQGQRKTCIGIVATLNQSFNQTWSKAIVTLNDQPLNIVNSLNDVITEAIKAYASANKSLPTHIILYKDGSGSSQIPVIVQQEIQKIQNGFAAIDPKYNPEFTYIMFNKKVNFRFFEQSSNTGGNRGGKGAASTYDNPSSGGIIFSDVVGNNFEFYLVPQKVTQGSATPTKFTVCHNNSNLELQTITQVTYFQCYNYFNWSGAVRVPGVAQYARKLASLVGDTFRKPVHTNLRLGQYYL